MSRVIATSMRLTLICTFRSQSFEVPIPAQPPERLLYDPPFGRTSKPLAFLSRSGPVLHVGGNDVTESGRPKEPTNG